MAWEAPFGITLQDAYYDVMDKLTNPQWFEFARCCLDLRHQIDDITTDYATRGIREQKYQMCKTWETKLGKFASVGHLYDLLNFFLRPSDFPSKPTPILKSEDSGLPDKVMLYCSRVGKIEVILSEKEEKSYGEFIPVYEKKYGRGLVLIFNNEHFGDMYMSRKGSFVDVENMSKLWTDLGNDVEIFNDLISKDMLSKMKSYGESSSKFDYLVVIVSTHGGSEGGRDYVIGIDEEMLFVDDILKVFDNKQCPNFHGLPKIFFFQSSRGNEIDKGCPSPNLDEDEEVAVIEKEERHQKPSSGDKNTATLKAQEKGDQSHPVTVPKRSDLESSYIGRIHKEPSSNQGQREHLPTVSDMLVCYSATRGFHSFRNSQNGSWFLNAVTNIFMKHAKSEHILDLMVKVNEAIAERSSFTAVPEFSGCKCMSQFECTLRKRLYLLNVQKTE